MDTIIYNHMESEKQVMDRIISERPPVSFVSGQNLSTYLNCYLRYNCCAHVIPKAGHIRLPFPTKDARNKHLRLNEDNIVLVTPHEHHLIDHGTEDQRARYEKENNCGFGGFFAKKEKLIFDLQQVIRSAK